jgi:hypothetical protein
MTASKHPVANPTYIDDIADMFRLMDIGCMAGQGVDLDSYYGVKLNADRIYIKTRQGVMPPDAEGRWSDAMLETFHNWIAQNYPHGQTVRGKVMLMAKATTSQRIRRDITTYTQPEIDLLKKAFQGIMDLPDDDPNSYFQLAGMHWLPAPDVYCRHHEDAFNPWHRAYAFHFENALRTIAGCEDITMPYWNIYSGELPAIFDEAPFANYTLPRDLKQLDGSTKYAKGYVTSRNDHATIKQELLSYQVNDHIDQALEAHWWEDFNGWSNGQGTHTGIIRAHDGGHDSIGPTMAEQDVAAFDPIFWFFHGNWDRLWWRWQQEVRATDTAAFKKLIHEDPFWFNDDVINKLEPFETSSPAMISLTDLGADYEHPEGEIVPSGKLQMLANVSAGASFKLKSTQMAAVHVTGINRLKIPGSFSVALQVDGTTIAKQAVFQPQMPDKCPTCIKNAIANLVFDVDIAKISSGRIGVEIMANGPSGKREVFPAKDAGNPQIQVHMILNE